MNLSDADVYPVLEKVLSNEDLSVRDVERLLKSEDLWALGFVANSIKRKMYGNVCTYIRNMILNYTNICVIRCRFCAFWRRREDPDAYLLSPREAYERVKNVKEKFDIKQVLIQGGVNPELSIEYFEEMFRLIKKLNVAIHGLSPMEIYYLAKRERMSYKEVFDRLKASGLDTLPGGGAELLVERVRKILSPAKIDTDTWLEIIEVAHKLGINTSVTMMFGHVETVEERAIHLYKLKELQRRSPGSLAFIAWNYEPGGNELGKVIKYPHGAYELLKIVSVARMTFRELIPHIQAGWLTVGKDAAQLSLIYGADDWGGTLYDERVIPATGMQVRFPRVEEIKKWISYAGCVPRERDNWYRVIE